MLTVQLNHPCMLIQQQHIHKVLAICCNTKEEHTGHLINAVYFLNILMDMYLISLLHICFHIYSDFNKSNFILKCDLIWSHL